ncbi:hypothetical protein BGW39_008014 [Mortierella sp. 14UC]|nr:hypothetical protein BGW39_008014 [Mortierella sp. 14UC]
MSTTFPLPPECLDQIVRKLAHRSDYKSLVVLLRTYEYTVPNIPKTHISDLLRAAYPLPQDPIDQEQQKRLQGSAPSVPYHSLVTNISLTHCYGLFDGEFHDNNNSAPRILVDYVEQNGLEDRYRAEEPLVKILEDAYWNILFLSVSRDLRRDLTWAFCSDVERVKSLSICLKDIGRYLPLVDRLKVLSSVTFLLDRKLNDVNLIRKELTPQQWAVLDQQRQEQTRHLDQMLVFVQEHRRIHRGVLRNVACQHLFTFIEQCRIQYEQQLFRLLPPLVNLQFLSHENWARFVARIKETNLSAVKVFQSSPYHKGDVAFSQILRRTPFLHRCRSLEKIEMSYTDKDVFQWAVDERRQYDADMAAGRSPRQPLVPLQEVHIEFDGSFNGRLFDSIGYAFSDTLKSLRAHCIASNNSGPDQDVSDCSFGRGLLSSSWSTPKLVALIMESSLLHIHPSLLTGLPNLVCLSPKDKRADYATADIVPWEAADLQHLTHLTLRGTPALSFHPDTLYNTPNLGLLILETVKTRNDNILTTPLPLDEVVEEGEEGEAGLSSTSSSAPGPSPRRPPIWTWNWKLPMLTILKLNTVFASRFQFRMLEGTPNLYYLTVTIRYSSPLYRRTVCVEEFLKNTTHDQRRMEDMQAMQDNNSNNNNDNNNNGNDPALLQLEEKYIHLPNLSDCYLAGPWNMDKSVLEVLCSKVAPNTESLCLRRCSGFDMVDWVSITSRHLTKLQETFASVPVTPGLVSAAGLVAVNEVNVTDFRLAPSPGDREGAEHGALYRVCN